MRGRRLSLLTNRPYLFDAFLKRISIISQTSAIVNRFSKKTLLNNFNNLISLKFVEKTVRSKGSIVAYFLIFAIQVAFLGIVDYYLLAFSAQVCFNRRSSPEVLRGKSYVAFLFGYEEISVFLPSEGVLGLYGACFGLFVTIWTLHINLFSMPLKAVLLEI